MRLLLMGNQGGKPDIDFNCAIAKEWTKKVPGGLVVFAVWLDEEAEYVRLTAPYAEAIYSYESFLRTRPEDWRIHVERLNLNYPKANWSAVIAGERSFVDSSFLLGGAGHRTESNDYVERILVNCVRFFELLF